MSEAEARRIVRERAQGRCELCHRPATNFAHRAGRGQGGLWLPSNGILLCGSGTTGCHGWTTHEPRLAALGGWRIETGEMPTDVPVWLRSPYLAGWHLLDDAGCYEMLTDLGPAPVLPEWVQAA